MSYNNKSHKPSLLAAMMRQCGLSQQSQIVSTNSIALALAALHPIFNSKNSAALKALIEFLKKDNAPPEIVDINNVSQQKIQALKSAIPQNNSWFQQNDEWIVLRELIKVTNNYSLTQQDLDFLVAAQAWIDDQNNQQKLATLGAAAQAFQKQEYSQSTPSQFENLLECLSQSSIESNLSDRKKIDKGADQNHTITKVKPRRINLQTNNKSNKTKKKQPKTANNNSIENQNTQESTPVSNLTNNNDTNQNLSLNNNENDNSINPLLQSVSPSQQHNNNNSIVVENTEDQNLHNNSENIVHFNNQNLDDNITLNPTVENVYKNFLTNFIVHRRALSCWFALLLFSSYTWTLVWNQPQSAQVALSIWGVCELFFKKCWWFLTYQWDVTITTVKNGNEKIVVKDIYKNSKEDNAKIINAILNHVMPTQNSDSSQSSNPLSYFAENNSNDEKPLAIPNQSFFALQSTLDPQTGLGEIFKKSLRENFSKLQQFEDNFSIKNRADFTL